MSDVFLQSGNANEPNGENSEKGEEYGRSIEFDWNLSAPQT